MLNKPKVIASLPALLVMASCVPPLAEGGGTARALSAAAPSPGFFFDALPPASSLGQLAPAQEARWQKAGGLFAAPSATPAEPFAPQGDEGDRGRALECLTTAVYYEARSESLDGQRAVAQVVLNRVRHPAFPSSICGVVYQGSGRRTGCQFSFTCDGSLGRRREPAAWEQARRVAARALGGEVYAPVGNATHYHTRAILPYWASSLTHSATVGAHIFYRWRGGAGRAGAFRQSYAGFEAAPAARPAVHSAAAAAPKEGLVERVRKGGEVVTIHRGTLPRQASRVTEQFGVRIHVGAPPPTGT